VRAIKLGRVSAVEGAIGVFHELQVVRDARRRMSGHWAGLIGVRVPAEGDGGYCSQGCARGGHGQKFTALHDGLSSLENQGAAERV